MWFGLSIGALHKSTLQMKHVLHCPQVSVNLLSIYRFCIDNDCYFVLIRSNFFVKDNLIGCTLLQEWRRTLPYQVDQKTINNFCSSVALIGVWTSLDILGHPSSHITKSVIKFACFWFNLHVSGCFNLNSICQSYLKEKIK